MMRGELELTILGSGTSTGVPVIGCACDVCSSTVPQNNRTRCSALLSWQGKQILLDSSTDFRQQALREGIRQIDAVLFTHAHADHIHGIDDLRVFTVRGEKIIPIYGAAETLEMIRRGFSYIFTDAPEPGFVPRLETIEANAPFELFGLPVEPLELKHGDFPCQGYRIGPMAYLTDCNGIPRESRERLDDLELLVLDGLRLKPHATHFNLAQAIEAAQEIGARRTLLTHLSHEVDHERHNRELPPGIELAYDGLRIRLPYNASQGDPI